MSVASRQRWRRSNRAKKIGTIDKPTPAIVPEFVMARFTRATREEIKERTKRMHALKVLWRGDIPLKVLRDFDS